MAKQYTLQVEKIAVDPVYDEDNNLETYSVKGDLTEIMTEEMFNEDGSLNGVHKKKRVIQTFGARLKPFFVFNLPGADAARKKAIGDEVIKIANAAIAAYHQAVIDEVENQKIRPRTNAMGLMGFDKIDSGRLKTNKPV